MENHEWRFGENKDLTGSGITMRSAFSMVIGNLNKNDPRPVIPLSNGDPSLFPSFRTSTVADDAVCEALRSGNFNGYSTGAGLPAARRAVADLHSKDLPYKVSIDDVILTNGGTQALEALVTVLARPNANILLPRPGYPDYEARAQFSRLEIRYFNLLPEKNWDIDLDAVEALSDANTAAMVIINPGNPCGNVFEYEHLKKVGETARKLGIFVIADEVYCHVTFGNKTFVPMGTFASIVPVITIGSLSKRWVAPGWRLGWLVTNDPNGILAKKGIIDSIKGFRSITPDSPTIVQGALPKILENIPDDFLSSLIDTLRENSDICYTQLKDVPCLTCPTKPEGSMFQMAKLDLSLLEGIKDDVDFCLQLAKEENMVLLPGVAFALEGWLRFSFAIELSSLYDGLARFQSFCHRHAKKQ